MVCISNTYARTHTYIHKIVDNHMPPIGDIRIIVKGGLTFSGWTQKENREKK